MTNCSFVNNTATDNGWGGAGAVSVGVGTAASMTNCSFVSNIATTTHGYASAGAVSVRGSTASMTNCSFVDNMVTGNGWRGAGAVSVQGGTASMTNCSFVNNLGNTSVGGGAVFALSGSTASIAGCTFRKPAEDSKGHNDIYRCVKGQSSYGCESSVPTAVVTFKCPAGTVGESVTMVAQDLLATQLPPATEVVHCTPMLP